MRSTQEQDREVIQLNLNNSTTKVIYKKMSAYRTNKLQIQKSAVEKPATSRQKISIPIKQCSLYIAL